MRLSPILLLPTLSLAQSDYQAALKSNINAWLGKAKSFIPSSPPNPVDAGASTVAAHTITRLTTDNWQSTLVPTTKYANTGATDPETWMILVTGQNRTCLGRCAHLEVEFNKSVALLSASPSAPNLGLIDCDESGVLCSTWMAGPPSVWYVQLPVYEAHAQTPAATDVRVKHLNLTTTTAGDLVGLHKTRFAEVEPIESVFHPWDGQLAKFGVQVPLGYVLYWFSRVPSWSVMLLVSFVTRTFMNRRVGQQQAAAAGAGAQRGGAPAANNR